MTTETPTYPPHTLYPAVSLENPFTPGSYRSFFFEKMKDGQPHTLRDLCGYTDTVSMRQDASVIRNIRAHPKLDVIYDKTTKTYRMTDVVPDYLPPYFTSLEGWLLAIRTWLPTD